MRLKSYFRLKVRLLSQYAPEMGCQNGFILSAKTSLIDCLLVYLTGRLKFPNESYRVVLALAVTEFQITTIYA